MEEACGLLEREFKRICNDLEYVAHRMEDKFGANSGRIRALESRLANANTRVESLIILRKTCINEVAQLLLQNYDEVTKLSETVRCANNLEEADNRRHELVSCLNSCPYYDLGNMSTESTIIRDNNLAIVKTNNSEIDDKNNFDEIAEKDFLNVPKSIRGRCNIDELKRLHVRLCHDFKEIKKRNKNKQPDILSIQDLESMGFKVSGKTGECMIATLRHLGVITITRNGIQLSIVANKKTLVLRKVSYSLAILENTGHSNP